MGVDTVVLGEVDGAPRVASVEGLSAQNRGSNGETGNAAGDVVKAERAKEKEGEEKSRPAASLDAVAQMKFPTNDVDDIDAPAMQTRKWLQQPQRSTSYLQRSQNASLTLPNFRFGQALKWDAKFFSAAPIRGNHGTGIGGCRRGALDLGGNAGRRNAGSTAPTSCRHELGARVKLLLGWG